MAEEVESGAAMHLSHDPFRSGVDAFGAAVVVGQGEAGVDGCTVDSRPLEKLCSWDSAAARAAVIHSVSFRSLPRAGVSRAAKSRRAGRSSMWPGPGAGEDRRARGHAPRERRLRPQESTGSPTGYTRSPSPRPRRGAAVLQDVGCSSPYTA